jgi:hypothetical protein
MPRCYKWISGKSCVTPWSFSMLLVTYLTFKLAIYIFLILLQTLQSTYWLIILNPEGDFFIVSIKKCLIGIKQEFIWNKLKSSASKGCEISYSVIDILGVMTRMWWPCCDPACDPESYDMYVIVLLFTDAPTGAGRPGGGHVSPVWADEFAGCGLSHEPVRLGTVHLCSRGKKSHLLAFANKVPVYQYMPICACTHAHVHACTHTHTHTHTHIQCYADTEHSQVRTR